MSCTNVKKVLPAAYLTHFRLPAEYSEWHPGGSALTTTYSSRYFTTKNEKKLTNWHTVVFLGLLGVTLPVDKSGGIRKSIADDRRFVLSDGRNGPSQSEIVRRFWPEGMLGVRWFALPVLADPFWCPDELEHFGMLEVMLLFEVVLFELLTLTREVEFGSLFCVCSWSSNNVNSGKGSGPLALSN